jgi:hypothetical protein
VALAAAIRDTQDQVGTINDVEVEEAESTDALIKPAVRGLLHIAEEEQGLLNLGEPKAIGREVEVHGETGDAVEIGVFRARDILRMRMACCIRSRKGVVTMIGLLSAEIRSLTLRPCNDLSMTAKRAAQRLRSTRGCTGREPRRHFRESYTSSRSRR